MKLEDIFLFSSIVTGILVRRGGKIKLSELIRSNEYNIESSFFNHAVNVPFRVPITGISEASLRLKGISEKALFK